jgi:hypothetical protein
MADTGTPAGPPFALGRFRPSRGDDFCGVVIGTDVVPLAVLHPTARDVESLLAAWPASLKLLGAAVDEAVSGRGWASAARPAGWFTPLAPFRPGQVFQSGANYKTHVVQLVTAAAAGKGTTIPTRHASARPR